MQAMLDSDRKPEDIPFEAKESIEQAVRIMLSAIGENPDREGLLRTPERVARMYAEVTSGYRTDPAAIINEAIFTVDYNEMVIVRDIDFFSLCEHHMLPFWGRAHVAYIPAGRVLGLSKIPRIVEMFARRLQVQERMTVEIAHFVQRAIEPRGIGVVVDGSHMCSMMRGIKQVNAGMVTSAMLGVFKEEAKTRDEFMAHLERGEER